MESEGPTLCVKSLVNLGCKKQPEVILLPVPDEGGGEEKLMFLQASSEAQAGGISVQDSETPLSHPEMVLLFRLLRKQREGHTSLLTSAQDPCYLFIFYFLNSLQYQNIDFFD